MRPGSVSSGVDSVSIASKRCCISGTSVLLSRSAPQSPRRTNRLTPRSSTFGQVLVLPRVDMEAKDAGRNRRLFDARRDSEVARLCRPRPGNGASEVCSPLWRVRTPCRHAPRIAVIIRHAAGRPGAGGQAEAYTRRSGADGDLGLQPALREGDRERARRSPAPRETAMSSRRADLGAFLRACVLKVSQPCTGSVTARVETDDRRCSALQTPTPTASRRRRPAGRP